MSRLLQVRLDEKLKAEADSVFSSMGLDTSTAIRMFLIVAVETRSLPFEVKVRTDSAVRTPFKYGSRSNSVNSTVSLENAHKMSRADVFGCMRGQFQMADDFDAPLEDFKEYME